MFPSLNEMAKFQTNKGQLLPSFFLIVKLQIVKSSRLCILSFINSGQLYTFVIVVWWQRHFSLYTVRCGVE